MSLLDRYLAAVGRALPKTQRRDILAELRDELSSQVEALAERLGRPAGEDDLAELVRAYGHPLVVAGRYSSHNTLIGPRTYPVFVDVTRLVLAATATFYVLLGLLRGLLGGDLPQAAPHIAWELAQVALFEIGGLVLLFAALDRDGGLERRLSSWSPRSLPAARIKEDPRRRLAGEIALGVLFIGLWTRVIPVERLFHYDGPLMAELTPAFDLLWWAVLALAVVRLLSAAGELYRGDWVRLFSGVNVMAGLSSLGVLWWAWRALPLVIFSGAPAAEGIQRLTARGMTVGLVLLAIGVCGDLIRDGRRLAAGRGD